MAADRLTAKDDTKRVPWARRIAWFVGLWAAGVGVLGAIAFAIRAALNA